MAKMSRRPFLEQGAHESTAAGGWEGLRKSASHLTTQVSSKRPKSVSCFTLPWWVWPPFCAHMLWSFISNHKYLLTFCVDTDGRRLWGTGSGAQ